MTAYPLVLSEAETLARVCAGASLARYGDGEFNLCAGGRAKRQEASTGLKYRLRRILIDSGDCLIGIPNLHSETPKAAFWGNYRNAASLLADRTYGSAFVTRPDSAPWIDTPEYWQQLESLWLGQAVTLVRGSGLSLTAQDLVGASQVTELLAPGRDAWAVYPDILKAIGTPTRVLLCLGPTATVLAVDLCARGVHAIDLGHVGLFRRKHLRGEPLVVTEADKVAA